MRFQVPQFIDVEDKIIGPLTLRQFLYLAAGFGISMVFYFTVKFFIWIIITLIIGILALAMAFLKINSQPLSKILLAMLNFYLKPQIYVWQPDHPEFPKTEENIKKTVSFDLISNIEKIISGFSLKQKQEKVLVGALPSSSKVQKKYEETKERYEVFKKISGEKRAAKRVDYR